MSIKIKNTETGEIVEIKMSDSNGIEYTRSIIDEYAANDLTQAPKETDYDYLADSDTINWWVDYCSRYESALLRLAAKGHNKNSFLDHISGVEFNDLPDKINEFCESQKNRWAVIQYGYGLFGIGNDAESAKDNAKLWIDNDCDIDELLNHGNGERVNGCFYLTNDQDLINQYLD